MVAIVDGSGSALPVSRVWLLPEKGCHHCASPAEFTVTILLMPRTKHWDGELSAMMGREACRAGAY